MMHDSTAVAVIEHPEAMGMDARSRSDCTGERACGGTHSGRMRRRPASGGIGLNLTPFRKSRAASA